MSTETRAHVLGLAVALLIVGLFYVLGLVMHSGSASGAPSLEVTAFEKEWRDGPEVVAAGAKYYDRSCSDCHANDASGDEGPDLRRFKKSNARMASMIRNGIPHEMPSFRKKYNDEQIHAMIVYLRTLK